MGNYTTEELTEALRAINSVINKCEKAQKKFPEGKPAPHVAAKPF